MLNDATGFKHIYIACGYSDMRRGIDGMVARIKNEFELDPFEKGNVFLFCGRRSDRIKALLYEGDGFLLMYKRLSNGHYQWPRTKAEARSITQQQYRWLMDGLCVEQKKTIREATPTRL